MKKKYMSIIFFLLGSISFTIFMYVFYIFCLYYNENIEEMHTVKALSGDLDFSKLFILINSPTGFDWTNSSIGGVVLLHIYWILIGGALGLLLKAVKTVFSHKEKKGAGIKLTPILIFIVIFSIFIVVSNMINKHKPVSRSLNDKLANAVFQNDLVAAEELLKKGANPNIEACSIVPMVFSSKKNNKKMMRLLIKYNADVNINSNGYTPLMLANDAGAARILIDHGADVNGKGAAGEPTINHHLGINKELLLLLLKEGAKLNETDNVFGETVLDHAYSIKCSPEIILLLKKYGAKTAKELEAEKTGQKKNKLTQ